jgi:hypothetical protein
MSNPPQCRATTAAARESDTVSWLVGSILLSVALTVLLNVGPRLFRGARGREASAVRERQWPAPDWPAADESRMSHRRVRVWAPWKAMIVGSVVLTIVVNLVLRIL